METTIKKMLIPINNFSTFGSCFSEMTSWKCSLCSSVVTFSSPASSIDIPQMKKKTFFQHGVGGISSFSCWLTTHANLKNIY